MSDLNHIKSLNNINVVCLMRHGSHLYGLNTPNSDSDYKGVYIPDAVEALLGIDSTHITVNTSNEETKNTKDDVDVTLYSISRFLELLIEGDTVAIDMIHCDAKNLMETSDLWKGIVDMRSMFYTKNTKVLKSYVRKQAHKYGIKGSRINTIKDVLTVLNSSKSKTLGEALSGKLSELGNKEFVEVYENNNPAKALILVAGSKYFFNTPVNTVVGSLEKKLESYGNRADEAAVNKGVDWKSVSHAIRAAYQLEEIMLTGDLKYPLASREYLLSVKLGKLDFTTQVAPELDRITERISTLSEDSNYPQAVDSEAVYKKISELLGEYI